MTSRTRRRATGAQAGPAARRPAARQLAALALAAELALGAMLPAPALANSATDAVASLATQAQSQDAAFPYDTASEDGTHAWHVPFGQDTALSGVYGSKSVGVRVPGYWDPKGATLHLRYRVSQLISSDGSTPASLTVLVDGSQVDSFPIAYAPDVQSRDVDLGTLTARYHTVEVTGYASVYEDEGCVDFTNGDNWTLILGSSEVEATYALRPASPADDLSTLPYPLVSTADATGSSLGVYFADQDGVAAALGLRTWLGGQTTGADDIEFRSASGDLRPNRIVVGLASDMPQGMVDPAGGRAEGEAVLRTVSRDENGTVLALYADDAEALSRAAAAITSGQPGYLQGGARRSSPAPPAPRPWAARCSSPAGLAPAARWRAPSPRRSPWPPRASSRGRAAP